MNWKYPNMSIKQIRLPDIVPSPSAASRDFSPGFSGGLFPSPSAPTSGGEDLNIFGRSAYKKILQKLEAIKNKNRPLVTTSAPKEGSGLDDEDLDLAFPPNRTPTPETTIEDVEVTDPTATVCTMGAIFYTNFSQQIFLHQHFCIFYTYFFTFF